MHGSKALVLTRFPRRYDEAKKAYQEVLDLDPQNSVALGFMGMVHHLTGDIDKAILTYHEVRELHAHHAFCINTNCRH